MVFWRTFGNAIHPVKYVDSLGFSVEDPSYIPDFYLEDQEFIILRTCMGVGDWGIISAMPRKLKQKYPDCKVLVPNRDMLFNMFGHLSDNWDSWDNPFNVSEVIFKNNPYVDGFIDYFSGEIFNDHYRLYSNKQEPLLKQVLRFWQFEEYEMQDVDPEMYWTDEEKSLGDAIINQHTGTNDFFTVLISNRYKEEELPLIQSKIDELNTFNYPAYYWFSNPNINLNFKKALDLRHVDIRVQMYIKSKAKFNIGNQTGVHDTISPYAPTYTLPRGDLGSNIVNSQIYF